MSLDEGYISNREAVLRGHEDDERRRFEDYQEQCLVESIEAMESHWVGVMAQQPEWMRNVHYDGPTVDRGDEPFWPGAA